MTRQGLGDKTYGLLQVPSQWTILHASQVLLVSLALNVVVLYILVFVYYGFCEIIFFCYMYIFRIGKTIKKRKKKEEKNPIWENCYAPMSMIYWTIVLLNSRLVIVKLLTVVCLFFFICFSLFFKIFCIRVRPMLVLESTVLLHTGVI